MKRTQKSISIPNEDFQLIHAFLAKDCHAFDNIVQKYRSLIYNLCLRLLGNTSDADDCAQETFIKVYQNLHRFRFSSSFLTWLYRITVNTCKNKLVSASYKTYQKAISLDHPLAPKEGKIKIEISDEANSPASLYEKKERQEIIYQAIKSLPFKQKILIFLCDIEGRTYEEIAHITKLRLGTVKSGLARARHQLRLKLEGVLKNELP